MQESAVKKSYSVIKMWPDEAHKDVRIVKVEFRDGIAVEIMNLGGIIRSLEVPDRKGHRENIVLRYDSLSRYFQDKAYLGCLVGRYANRIKNGTFYLNGKKYRLTLNHGEHHLHGGYNGFDKQVWKLVSVVELHEKVIVNLFYNSPGFEQGYPGKLEVSVAYVITANAVEVVYKAVSDEDTIFNPTNHSYFNLSGNSEGPINDHWLKIEAEKRLSVDADLIPDGRLVAVAESGHDFSKGKLIVTNKYDTCYKLDGATVLRHETTGREMIVTTSFPGIQLYTGDYLEGSGIRNRSGICLETQFFPDSPNHPHFPSATLRQGERFSQSTMYRFGIC